MPQPLPAPNDLAAAASDALRGDPTKLRAMLAGVRERAETRAREEIRKQLNPVPPGAKPPARAPSPTLAPVPQRVPPTAPDWPVQMTLPKGRRVRATFDPPLARRDELTALGRVSAANDQQAAAELQRQRTALDQLRRSHEALAQKVGEIQEQADQMLLNLLQGLDGFERRLRTVKTRQKTLQAQHVSARAVASRQREELRSLATTARIQQVTAVVSSVQSAAYGQRGSVLATDNLLLAANELFWMFLDPLMRAFGVISGPGPSVAAWLSPLGTLATGHLVLGNRQHQRFISGVVEFTPTGPRIIAEALRPYLADGFFEEFRRRTDVPVTLAPQDGQSSDTYSAVVRAGVLLISTSEENNGHVAWMIDLGADIG